MRSSLFFSLFFSKILLSIPGSFLTLENHRLSGHIHQFDTVLREEYVACHKTETLSPMAAGYCAIIRNEWQQGLSPVRQIHEMERIRILIDIMEHQELEVEERFFIQMRLYAYLPRGYGQNFIKSILALESLKRLKPGIPNLLVYEKEIRFLQGKHIEGLEPHRLEKEVFLGEKGFGWFTGIGFIPHNGLRGDVGYRDDSLNDGPWGMHIRGSASTLLLFGVGGGVFYEERDSLLDSSFKFTTGRREYFGLGADSSLSALEYWQVQKTLIRAGYTYYFTHDLIGSTGFQLSDVRITDPTPTSYSHVGPLLTLKLDEMDQESDPRLGYRVNAYGLFLGYQQFGLEVRFATPFWAGSHLNLGSFLETQFGGVPVLSHLELGSTFHVPGVSVNRFMDKTVTGAWAELRQELITGMGGGFFASSNFVGSSIDDSFRHRTLFGGGIFLDWRWTRFPRSDVRVELSRFVDETLFQIGVVQGF